MNFFNKKLNKNNQGSILLLALLIMSGSVVTGLVVGTIVLNEVRQSRNIDDAITSYYVAESGIEQGVYLYRKDNATFLAEIEEIDTGDPPPSSPQDCYMDNWEDGRGCATYFQDAASQTFTILPGSVQQVNFFNETLASGFGINSLEVAWSDANPDNGVEPWLEMEVIELLPNFETGEPVVFVQTCGAGPVCNPIDSAGYSVASNYFETSKNYKIRFRPLYDTVDVQEVIAYDGVGGSGDIISNRAIDIFTTGSFRTSQQSLRAQLSSGIDTTKPFVDFVLFSECDLVKGDGQIATCP